MKWKRKLLIKEDKKEKKGVEKIVYKSIDLLSLEF